MNNLLDVLTREGVLINVSVRYWRGCKKLKPEDIGLKADAVSDRLISLGHKRILPKEATAELALKQLWTMPLNERMTERDIRDMAEAVGKVARHLNGGSGQ